MTENRLTIGDLELGSRVILAPMAGISSLPYRLIMKSFGTGLVFTEMISINGLIRDGAATRQLMVTDPLEYPLGIQLFGNDPEIFSQAVAMIRDEARLIDINMGCPVRKVVGSGSGSALLRDPRRVAAILAAVRKVYDGPLTIKIRSGWDNLSLNYMDIGRIAEDQGVNAVTLHPRTRAQGFSGSADWEQIATLKRCLNIPVIGSGDIFKAEDGIAMLRQTNCDAIMIGRGGYGNPWLIRQINAMLEGSVAAEPEQLEKLQTVHRHMELHRQMFGDHKTLLEMRKHLCWYARGLDDAAHFRHSVQQGSSMAELLALAETFFTREQTR